MVYALSHVSGAHINPAVTLGLWAAGRMPLGEVAPYVASQLGGAAIASLTLRALIAAATLGETIPAVSTGQAFVLEATLTSSLMLVILLVTARADRSAVLPGFAIGGVVALAALLAGPITGGSMNPARSLGPAMAGGQTAGLWIYMTAPFLGALIGVAACRLVRPSWCCSSPLAGTADR